MKRLQLILLATTLFFSAFAHGQLIKADGSSTVFPITEAMAEDFQASTKNRVKMTVGISGTGGGFKKFCRGEIDISNASRPILATEIELCKAAGVQYYELPIAFDAITVVVSAKNTWLQSITVEELKKMWEPAAQGRIKTWKQVNSAWPDTPIKLYGPGADSGTFDYFTEAVVGKAKSSRGDYNASEDDNILVQGVSQDTNSLGYFGFAYYIENKETVRAVPIVNKGKPIVPSVESVVDGSYQPFSRPIFIYVNVNSYQRKEVKDFVEFYLASSPALVKEVKYIPLPQKAYDANRGHLVNNKVGTRYGGTNKVGLTIDQLLQLETK